MHYMKWTRVILPVVFEEFEVVQWFIIFLLLFPFNYHCQLVKGQLQQKSGGGCSPLTPSLPSLHGFYGREICSKFHFLDIKFGRGTISFIIFENFAKFQYSFHSPQVKRNLISSIRNFIYKLPHKLLNDLRLGILGNKEILRKPQKLHGDTALCQTSPE